MSWSFNEIEGLCRKAARGSGLSWGLAEEAGKAARWLAGEGLPGPEMLAELLVRNDGAAYETLRPLDTAQEWTASSHELCPLITGAVICDHADQIAKDKGIDLGPTSYPLLLVPYVAGAAHLIGETLAITWDKTHITIDPQMRMLLVGGADTETSIARKVTIRHSDIETVEATGAANRGDISRETADTLRAFAHRTYAPDTPESRRTGAGAGLTDND